MCSGISASLFTVFAGQRKSHATIPLAKQFSGGGYWYWLLEILVIGEFLLNFIELFYCAVS